MAFVSPNWVRAGFALAAVALLAARGVIAAPPQVVALFPTGGQRGTTVTATLNGEGLKNLSGFFSVGTGVTARVLPGGDDKTRTAEIVVAKDAPLGIQQVRFFDPDTGLTNARFFQVGQWPEVMEKEPNDEPAQAMRVVPPVTVNGRISQNPDRDGFVFHARAGETVVCEVHGLRVLGQIGDSWLKGYLEITDASGKTLAASEGTSDDYYRWDPMIPFTPSADGDYIVWFRDLNWRGDVRGVYRLTIGAVPHVTGIFPLGGRRGATVPVTFVGVNCGGPPAVTENVVVPPTGGDETMPVSLAAPGGTTNARPFQPGDLPETMQAGDNNTREKAQPVPFPGIVNGRLASENARDYYRFHVDAKQNAVLEVFSRRLGTPADPEMFLYDAKTGNLIQADDDGRGADCWINRELAPGDYVVCVHDLQDRGGPAYGYRLSLGPPRPALSLATSPDAPTLARGANVTLTVRIKRDYGWDGDVHVTLADPPPGVRAAPITILKGKSEGQLIVAAAADAPKGIARLTVVGTATPGTGPALRAVSRASETYNIQGTAFQRELVGPFVFVTPK